MYILKMEASLQQFNYLNNLANNEVNSYREQVSSIDNLNNINKITGLTGLITNLGNLPGLISKSATGLRVLGNSMRTLPKAENEYFSTLKGNTTELNRVGLNEQQQLTLPENRISDFSRKYYNDDEFRSNVENELNNGEGDLTRVAEEGGIKGITTEEARLGYNYGQAYRDFGNNLKVRNPEMTPEEIDSNVAQYSNRIENGLASNMKSLRDPELGISRPNLLTQQVQRVQARVTGGKNSEYEFLDDQREQLAGDRITTGETQNPAFETVASSGQRTAGGVGDTNQLEMNDLKAEDFPELSASKAENVATDLTEGLSEETSVSARMGEAVAERLATDVRTGAGSASEPAMAIEQKAPELFELNPMEPGAVPGSMVPKTAFPLEETPTKLPPTTTESTPATTTTETAPTAETAETAEAVESTEATASTTAETAGASISETAGTLAGEIGGTEATGILELAGSVLNPIMTVGSLALIGYQLYGLFNQQSKPPPPAVTYAQINEGE